jgi:hypothetical protein
LQEGSPSAKEWTIHKRVVKQMNCFSRGVEAELDVVRKAGRATLVCSSDQERAMNQNTSAVKACVDLNI